MKRTIPLALIFVAASVIPGYAQKMSLLQMNKLNSEVNRILMVFGKYSSIQPGDQIHQIPAEYNGIFAEDAWILNFLYPYEADQKQVSPGEYYRFIRDSYTAGLNIKLHWNFGNMNKPIAADAGNVNYIVYLPLTVTAIGLFNSQKILNLNREYYAILGFRFQNDMVSDVKILYIQSAKPMMNYKFEKEQKLAFGLYGGPGFTGIYSKDIFNHEIWDARGEFGYQAGLKAIYSLGKDIGLYGGIGLSNYRTAYEILDYINYDPVTYSQFDPRPKVDVDNDTYYELISATVTENASLTYLSIPIGIRYSIGKEKLRVTTQVGLDFSFLLSSRYSATGNSDHKGYYPEYHVLLYDLPDYGFIGGPVDANGKWELSTFNLSAQLSLGAEMKLHDNIFLFAGPFLNYGLTDLGYKTAKHRDDFLSISGDPGKLNTFSLGLMVELIYKL